MKNFRIVVTALMVALLAAVCVSAATVSYDLVAYDEEANQWEVTFTYNLGLDEESDEYANAVVGTYTTYFTFNPEKLVLTDTNYDAVTDYATAKGAPVYFYPTKSGRNEYTYSLTDAKEKTWTVLDNGNVQGYLTAYTQETVFEPNGTTVLSVAFSLAEGVTKEDIYKSDFVIDSVYIKDTANDVAYGYQYTNDTCDATLTVENNIGVEAPVVEEYWNAGNGYNLVDANKNVVANNSKVTKSNETETAVTVKYGGYYQNTDNWAGAALKEAVTVDGLEIEVTYTALPSSTDCWAFIGVLAEPSIFSTKADSYNKGYVNLLRYVDGYLNVRGTESWSISDDYGKGESFFVIEEGDVLRVCFDKNAEDTYDITYVKNGTETFKLPVALDLETALGGTTGYPVVSASCLGSEAGAFEYTVDVAPEEIKVAKIPVAAGDTVYEYTQDNSYTVTEIDADGTHNVTVDEDAYINVVVNSGYTAQKQYRVDAEAEGYYIEVEFGENNVLGSADVAMRANDPQGIKFFGSVSNEVISILSNSQTDFEYGFIMTAESAYNNLGDDYVLDIALVEAGKAKKGIAKGTENGKEVDKYFSRNDETTVIAGVLYGIPKTADGVKTVIVSKPYLKIGDYYIYGEETKSTLYDIAKKLLANENYEAVWEYAQEIIEIVNDTEYPEEIKNEIVIDVSSLYK